MSVYLFPQCDASRAVTVNAFRRTVNWADRSSFASIPVAFVWSFNHHHRQWYVLVDDFVSFSCTLLVLSFFRCSVRLLWMVGRFSANSNVFRSHLAKTPQRASFTDRFNTISLELDAWAASGSYVADFFQFFSLESCSRPVTADTAVYKEAPVEKLILICLFLS